MTTEKRRVIDRALNQIDDAVVEALNSARFLAISGHCALRNALENDGADAARLLTDFLNNVEALREYLAQKSERLGEMIDEIKAEDSRERER